MESQSAPLVLAAGKDRHILEIRSQVLETTGVRVVMATSETHVRLAAANFQFCSAIIGYTFSLQEQDRLADMIMKEQGPIPVLRMGESSVPPERLVRFVRESMSHPPVQLLAAR